jgi:predicted restriction endonuclease
MAKRIKKIKRPNNPLKKTIFYSYSVAKRGKRNYRDQRYVLFRRRVKARDGHKCCWPGCRCKTKLEVHHIQKWKDDVANRYNPLNGITLCRTHHKMIRGLENEYVVFFTGIILNKLKK